MRINARRVRATKLLRFNTRRIRATKWLRLRFNTRRVGAKEKSGHGSFIVALS